jgi:single-strand DNA-binding protein
MSDAQVSLAGNITREPELRVLPNGSSTTRFGIAVNRRWQDKASGDWKEETSFFDVVCWRDLADNVAESLHRGDRVVVVGRLEQRSWEDKGSGAKRSTVEVIADEVGPSLRWAQCRVERVERASNGAGMTI